MKEKTIQNHSVFQICGIDIRLMESRFADISITIYNSFPIVNFYMGENIRSSNGNANDYSTLMYPLVGRR